MVDNNKLINFTRWAILGQIMEDVLHELSNYLQIIAGFSEEIQIGLPTDSELYRFITTIVQKAQECSELIKQVNLKNDPIHNSHNRKEDINSALNYALSLLGFKIRRKGLILCRRIPSVNLRPLEQKPLNIRLMILIIIATALYKTKDKSKFFITTQVQEEKIHFEVKFLIDKSREDENCKNRENFLMSLDESFHLSIEGDWETYLIIFKEHRLS